MIGPYYFFLKKAVSSRELYVASKSNSHPEFNFEKMFYLHQLFIELFKVVKKMPLIGRYYKDKNAAVTCGFIEVIAVQAQKFYNYFKLSLQEVLSNVKYYLKSREEEQLMKAILDECLPFINEEMKKLFLDKYFYPYGKGICVKLFRTEEQNDQCCKIIKGIISDHEETERRHAQ